MSGARTHLDPDAFKGLVRKLKRKETLEQLERGVLDDWLKLGVRVTRSCVEGCAGTPRANVVASPDPLRPRAIETLGRTKRSFRLSVPKPIFR